jgi:hypothetical protein
MLDRQQIGFEFKAHSAMWTNQCKTDRISRKYPSPSNLVGIIQSVFNHPNIYPVVTRVDILSTPSYDSYTINGRKNLNINDNRDVDRTQLFIQPVFDVHYKIFFNWLHIIKPTCEDFRKTQNQTWRNLEFLINESTLPKIERVNSYKAGGKFGSIIGFHPLSETDSVDIDETETTPFYRFKNGEFYFDHQPFVSGTWQINKESLFKLIKIIMKDK